MLPSSMLASIPAGVEANSRRFGNPSDSVRKQKALEVGQFEDCGRQPLASDLDQGQVRLDRGHVLIGKAHLGRAEVFFHAARRVSKIGTMLGPLARSQASAPCAVVAPLANSELFDRLDHSLVGRLVVKRDDPAGKSFTPKLDVLATLPVR